MNTALLGMLLFIGSELMFFAGLFGAYFNTRATALGLGQPWPPSGLEDVIEPGIVPIVATIILVAQLVHDAVARVAHPQGRPARA